MPATPDPSDPADAPVYDPHPRDAPDHLPPGDPDAEKGDPQISPGKPPRPAGGPEFVDADDERAPTTTADGN